MPKGLLHLRAGLMAGPMVDPACGESVCAALRAQVERLGLSIGDEPRWADAVLGEQLDPFSQEHSLTATWRGGLRYGTASFFPDGRVFAEYQVLLPHPSQQDTYVESVQVWGTPPALRGDVVTAHYMV